MLGRFIEVDFPVQEVSLNSAHEKNIRRGHISALHIWWARRPLAASRTSIYASLIQEPKTEKDRKNISKRIIELSTWESAFNHKLMDAVKNEILSSCGGEQPKLIDPFSGGGAIPLESLRLGCQTYANDLNPVANLILKCTLEYPQKYGVITNDEDIQFGKIQENKLLKDVKKWTDWLQKRADEELGQYYPRDEDGSIPIGYIWAHVVKCNNPVCGAEIPLIKQSWLAKKEKRRIAFKIIPNGNHIDFEIREGNGIDFDPGKGTISGGKVRCPCCGSGLTEKEVLKKIGQMILEDRLIAVALHRPKEIGKTYRIANARDNDIFIQARKSLERNIPTLRAQWGFEPVPNEPTPDGQGKGAERAFSLRNKGITQWGQLFNERQQLSLLTLIKLLKESHHKILYESKNEEYAKVIVTYLAIVISRCADFESKSVRWFNHVENPSNTFSRQAISISWDYFELNLTSKVAQGNIKSMSGQVLRALEGIVNTDSKPAIITQGSATNLPYSSDFFDAVITDPPYYDNIPYSHLSDYFYVWLKRMLSEYYPDLFATPLTPKSEEIVTYSSGEGGYDGGVKFFEERLTDAFKEINRVLKPEGIACIVFAHKSTEAWETVVTALSNSGLYLTASWPINTEMKGRSRGQESAALASSIYMVCRKRSSNQSAYFKDIKHQIQERVHQKLDQFWNEGIIGSDLFISAIGPAMEVFGKYSSVEKISGERVSATELLEFVRKTVSEYALSKILNNPKLDDIDLTTRFYILWRWTYDSTIISFDGARLLAQAVGFELEDNWTNGIIKKEGENISVLDAHGRGGQFLTRGKFQNMIDILHASLLFWENNNRIELSKLLKDAGYLNNNTFWQVAQSISEVLSEGEKEKQMIQGFIYGKDSYGTDGEVPKLVKSQKSLDGWN